MDQALLSQLIKSYGAADTPENTNRIREFYGANPDQAERRVMGMKGSQGQQGAGGRDDILNAMLDKYIAPQVAQAVQAPEVSTGNVYEAPTGGGKAAPLVKTEGAMPTPLNTGPLPPRDATAAEKGGSGWEWLLAALGARAAADPTVRALPTPEQQKMLPAPQSSTSRMIENYNKDNPRLTYQPKLENQGPVEVRNSPELEAKGQANAEKYAQLKSEVDAENASRATADEAAALKLQEQMRTQKLLKAARAATGRR